MKLILVFLHNITARVNDCLKNGQVIAQNTGNKPTSLVEVKVYHIGSLSSLVQAQLGSLLPVQENPFSDKEWKSSARYMHNNMFSLEILNLQINAITLNLTVVNQLLHLQIQRQGMKHPKKIKIKNILSNNTKNKAITNDFINKGIFNHYHKSKTHYGLIV